MSNMRMEVALAGNAWAFSIRKLHNRIQEDRLMQRFIRKVDTEQAC